MQKQNLQVKKKYIRKLVLVATKPVFGVSDKVRFKPACSATENSYKNEISLVASLDMELSKGADQTARMVVSVAEETGLSLALSETL